MTNRNLLRALGGIVLACCATWYTNGSLIRGDNPPGAAKEAAAKEGKERAKPRGRLPAYYNKVIDNEQREKIYSIQDKYSPQVEELTKQLDKLTDQRDAEIAAILTDKQRKKVASLMAESRAKGDAGKAKPSAEAAASSRAESK